MSPHNPTIVDDEGFIVIGISSRTSNAKEMSGNGTIAGQWDRFMRDGVIATIPHRVDSSVIAVYTDYDSDAAGEYTHLIGARVSSADTVPQGMVAKRIPPARYAVFATETGPVQQVVPDAWMRIWAVPKDAAGGDRSYSSDFEVYDQRAANPNSAQVDIYVGIK
jgi:predicted transcriptional regulator YdeE